MDNYLFDRLMKFEGNKATVDELAKAMGMDLILTGRTMIFNCLQEYA